MTEIFVAEEHSQLYDLWLERGSRALSVCHVDFHCDMRGLLIDRRLGRARFVNRRVPYIHRLDSGSYLSHALMNGIVAKLRWVHDDFGGRSYDYLHCVKYLTDFSALCYRLPGAARWAPVSYAECTFADWDGPQPGEFLDIDWDGIAFVDYDENHIRRLMAEVLERDFEPEGVFLARSPGYCHPSDDLFEEFIAGLEKKFGAEASRIPPHDPVLPPASLFWDVYRKVDRRVWRLIHRLGL